MSLLEAGTTADAAVAREWQRAVAYALNGGKASSLVLNRPTQNRMRLQINTTTLSLRMRPAICSAAGGFI